MNFRSKTRRPIAVPHALSTLSDELSIQARLMHLKQWVELEMLGLDASTQASSRRQNLWHSLQPYFGWHWPLDPVCSLLTLPAMDHFLSQRHTQDVSLGCMLLFDVHGFSLFQSKYGVSQGNRMIMNAAKVMQHQYPEALHVRLGADTFGIWFEHSSCVDTEFRTFRHQLEETLSLEYTWPVRCSWAQAQSDALGQGLDYVLKRFDEHHRQVGLTRSNVPEVLRSELTDSSDDFCQYASLVSAIESNAWELYAQAIAPASSPESLSPAYEILLRWPDEQGVPRSAGMFLPHAQKFKLMAEVDRWVLQEAARIFSESPEILERAPFISINLSLESLRDPELLERLDRLFKPEQMPRNKICFEMTEGLCAQQESFLFRTLDSIRSMGFRLAVDDFGSGVASFAMLNTIPFDYIKIDGSIIESMERERTAEILVDSLSQIALSHGAQTIAEYVSNASILERLGRMGIDYAQGFYVAMPVPLRQLRQASARF